MTLANKDLSVAKAYSLSQTEVAAQTISPVYKAPQNRPSYVKKIILTNTSENSATFDIGVYENSIINSSNVFVTIANANETTAVVSTDGITWTTTTFTSATAMWSGIYANGIYFTSVGGSSSSAVAQSSTNGITWTVRTMPKASNWVSFAYGNGTWVSVSTNFTADGATSTDGITWTTRTTPGAGGNNYKQLAYGNGMFVATTSSAVTAYSTDGITWTQGSIVGGSDTWDSLVFAKGMFVALMGSSTASTVAATSTDGITWTRRTMPASAKWKAMAYGNGTFAALPNGVVTSAASSTDGISWTLRTLPLVDTWSRMTYGNGRFIAVGTTTNQINSTDGITWTLGTIGRSNNWLDIIYPQVSDFTNETYLYKAVTLGANQTLSVNNEIILPPTHEIRVRSTVPVMVSVHAEV